MSSTTANRVPSLDEAAHLSPRQVVDLVGSLSREVDSLKNQLDGFKRQVFGQTSERRLFDGADGPMSLGEAINLDQGVVPPPRPEGQVAAHTRRPTAKNLDAGDDGLQFFDDPRVSVEVIELAAPEAEGLTPDQYEVIGYKESFRLAQRPGSTVVLNDPRPVIKLKACQAIVCPASPSADHG